MTSTTQPLTAADQPAPSLEQEVSLLVSYQDAIARLSGEVDRIKARLRGELPVGSHQLAGVKVAISVAHRFDPKLAAERLSPELLATITETTTVVSGTLAKRVLPPAMYEQLTVVGSPQVRIS